MPRMFSFRSAPCREPHRLPASGSTPPPPPPGPTWSLGRCWLAWLILLASWGPGCSQYHTRTPADKINYEEKIGREFALDVSARFRWMDEPEVLDFLKSLGKEIEAQLPGNHVPYRFFVIRDGTLNAFAVPGGYIYFFAGMLAEVDSIDELAGVMAHEVGHVMGHHFFRQQQKLDLTNIATMAATILAATMGGGEEAAAVGTLAQAAQITTALHYSRQFEREADRTSIRLAHAAGYDPEGILSLFGKFNVQTRLNTADLPPYFRTHPLPTDRIFEVQNWIGALKLPQVKRKRSKAFDLARVTARLRTEQDDGVILEQEAAVKNSPGDTNARFLLGYLYLKRGNLPLAFQHLEQAFQEEPTSPEHALYLGRAHQLAGNLEEAGRLLDKASAMAPENVLAQVFCGDLRVQMQDTEAGQEHYRKAVLLNPDSYVAQQSLGMFCGRRKETGECYYHLGLADRNAGRYLRALFYLKKALEHLDPKSKIAEAVKGEIKNIEG